MRRMQRQLWELRRMQCGSWKDKQFIYKEEIKGGCKMGSSTGSMFYAFGAFLLIYLVGATIYQIYLWIKKWRENKEDNKE